MLTTHGPVKLSNYKGRWLVFFSHPGDFTLICTTEFIAFSKNYERFYLCYNRPDGNPK